VLTISIADQAKTFLASHPLFSLLGDDAIGRLARNVELVSFVMGETILSEGEAGDCAYLIAAGKVRAFKEGPAGQSMVLGTLGGGDLFGEQALLRNEPRMASARAAEDVVLFRIPRVDFDELLREHADIGPYMERLMRQRAVSNFLRLATFLGALPARQVMALLDQLQECRFQSGETIIREGEMGDRMFILKSGEVKATRGETLLAVLKEGDYFGERSLILREPRYASMIARTPVECFSLSREAFEDLLRTAPQLQEQLTRRLEQYARDTNDVQPLQPPSEPTWEEIGAGLELPAAPTRRGWRDWLPPWARYPFVPQEDETDCGAAVLAMIGRYHGRRLSVARLRDLANVGSTGASMLSLARAAEVVGFGWRAVTTDYSHLPGLRLPAVAHWNGYHYLALYDIKADRVVIGDPAVGLVRMRRPDFEKGWTGKLLLLDPTDHLHSQETVPFGSRIRLRLLAPYRTLLVLLILVSLVLAILPLTISPITERLIDRVLVDKQIDHLTTSIGGLFVVGVLLAALGFLRQFLLERLAQGMSGNMIDTWFDRLLKLPLPFSQSRPIGAFLMRMQVCLQCRQTIRLGMATLFDQFLLIGAVAMMIHYQISLGLIVFLGIALLIACVVSLVRPGVTRYYQRWLRDTARYSVMVEIVQGSATTSTPAAGASSDPEPTTLGLVAGGIVLLNTIILWRGTNLVLADEWTVGRLMAFQVLVVFAALPLLHGAWQWPQLGRMLFELRKTADYY
jgi:ATP-binding cassette subfamily B protein